MRRLRKWPVSPAFVLLLLTGTVVLSLRIVPATAATITVPDEYPTIQEAIHHAADGDTVFVRAGTYYEHVVVNRTVSLAGEDVETTILDGNNTGHVVTIVSDSVNVTGFTVQNNGNVDYPAIDAGFCLDGVSGCTLSGNRVSGSGFCGISLLDSQQTTVTGNNVTGKSWAGLHLLNSSHNTISRNIVHDNTYVGMNGHAASHYNNVTENVISNSTYGMFYHDATYNTICRNTISTIAVEGIWFQDQVSHNVVAENTLINATVAISLQGPHVNNTLAGNLITGAEYGVRIANFARSTRITENIIMHNRAGSDPWSAGIRLDSGRDSQIHANTILGNNYGILLYSYSPSVSVCGNNITGNEFGLRVSSGGSSYLNASDNIVMHNRGYGIGLTGFSSGSNYATISRNLIVNNSDGIALGQFSNYHSIFQNHISQNGYGFYIEYSTQNTIWGNNVVDNDQHVYVSPGPVNHWNAGYPTGGNYWSNYTGLDSHCGQHQDLPGSDGLGDTAHTINLDNQDHYPLISPWSWSPHDVGVPSVVLSKQVVGRGYEMHTNVTVANWGASAETTNVTLYANATILGSGAVVLSAGTSTTLTFPWNTSSAAYGHYILWADAEPVPSEAFTVDNVNVAGVVAVTLPGDVDGDRDVDIYDIVLIAGAYDSALGDPSYFAEGDFDDDGDIDIYDVVIAAGNYGEHW